MPKIELQRGRPLMPSSRVEFVKGNGGLPMLKVKTDSSLAEIYLHGAHVTYFGRKGEPPILWMSKESKFDEKSPIRGGVPVIFPWFGPMEGKAAHGFARVTAWELKEIEVDDMGRVEVCLELPESAATAEYSGFKAEYRVLVADHLALELQVTNTSKEKVFTFEDCLHTYFNVQDIKEVRISGLQGVRYLDKVAGGVEKLETDDGFEISSEVDRVYQDTKSTVGIHDSSSGRIIYVQKQGSNSTVVWNPWIAKSKAMADFGDEEYHGMVCVESGNVGKNKITLKPGESSTLKATISVVPMEKLIIT
jgi:D-hexose-6-phosphate mutarotase